MIPWTHLNAIKRIMENRKATELWLGIMGGKGQIALPNFQLGNGKTVLAFNGQSHDPDKNLVFEPEHLFGPMSMDDLNCLMEKAVARINERR